MRARKFTIAAAATVAGVATIGAIGAATGGHSNAGKAFASRPIVKTTVKTTHKVVHIKPKPKRIKVAAPSSAPTQASVAYVQQQPQAQSAPSQLAAARREEVEGPTSAREHDSGEAFHESEEFDGEHESEHETDD
jgi:hypothetical protein